MRTIIIALLVLVAACKKTDKADDIDDCTLRCGFGELTTTPYAYPACVQDIIRNGSTKYMEIREYVYKGKIAYLFMGKCCDRFNELYDCKCNYICSPSGGIGGGGDGKCPDFNEQASLVRVVWQE